MTTCIVSVYIHLGTVVSLYKSLLQYMSSMRDMYYDVYDIKEEEK